MLFVNHTWYVTPVYYVIISFFTALNVQAYVFQILIWVSDKNNVVNDIITHLFKTVKRCLGTAAWID